MLIWSSRRSLFPKPEIKVQLLTMTQNQAQQRNIQTPFGNNVYIVNHKRKHKFVSIAKGGCTNLKLITATDDSIKVKDKKEIHGKYRSRADGKQTILIGDDSYKGFVRVVFWRDPVKRFFSWYSDKVQHVYQPYLISVGFALDDSFERAIDFLKFELGKNESEWIEEHVRPQSLIYDINDVDVVVDMKDMDDYLAAIGVDIPKNINISSKPKKKMPEWVEKEVKQLYKADYDMKKRLESKWWDGKTVPKANGKRSLWLRK